MKNKIRISYIPEESKRANPISKYTNPIGVWRVTTEGDEEGRSIKDLGVCHGHICQIAFKLAHECGHSLMFTATDAKDYFVLPESEAIFSNRKRIDIHLDIDSNTWSLNPSDRAKWFKSFLNLDESSNIEVKVSNYYACVTLEIK